MSLDIHATSRRELLAASGVLFAWPFLPKLARAEGRDPRMLVIVLRGALDGLAAVAPVGTVIALVEEKDGQTRPIAVFVP